MYIYKIVHVASSTTYVGSTVNLVQRWGQHRRFLRGGKHHNPNLQKAWNQYGETAFEFVLLEQDIENQEHLIEREQYWLDSFRVEGNVYNCGTVAKSAMVGRTHSQETRDRLAELARGTTHNRGRKHSAQSRRNMSLAQKGKSRGPLSEEHKRTLSKARKGIVFSEEHKHRLSEANRGKKLSEEHKRNIRESCKGVNAGPYPAFCNEQTGEVIPAGINLTQLCREKGLRQSDMYRVQSGARRICQGWILAGDGT